VNVSQNVSQAAPQQQGNGGLPMGPQGMTVTHHHYHLLNHAGGPEVMAAMGVAGADQVGDVVPAESCSLRDDAGKRLYTTGEQIVFHSGNVCHDMKSVASAMSQHSGSEVCRGAQGVLRVL